VAGNTLYFALSGAGIVALLFASYRIFTLLKWAGAAYLAVLGLRALFARRQMAPDSSPGRVGERSRAFVSGFATQVANPKAIVFFIAVLPQFIDPRVARAATGHPDAGLDDRRIHGVDGLFARGGTLAA
jgi:homoserine/homoserine lactone efflux protein